MMLTLISVNTSFIGIVSVFVVHAILFSIQDGTMNTLVVEIFPTRCRFSCSAFCYSLGMGVIGGTSPAIASLITNNFIDPSYMLSIYVGGVSFLGFCSMCVLVIIDSKSKNKELTNVNNNENLEFSRV